MAAPYTVDSIAQLVGGTVRGDGSAVIDGVASVEEAVHTQATWVTSTKYASRLSESKAGVVLVPEGFSSTPMPAILCPRVDRSVALLLGAYAPPSAKVVAGIHPSAVIDTSAQIGADVSIAPNVVIEADVRIGDRCEIQPGVFIGRGSIVGDDCRLHANVVVRDGCVLGNRVTIQPCAVIGADGFGYYLDNGRHVRVPHIGGVRLEEDVEIGACTCVDRAKFGETVIGAGTKIDNQVQVGHNTRVGEHCVIAGQAGVSGSVRIGRYCTLGGAAGCIDNISIGDGASIAAVSVATKDVPDGTVVSGTPAQEHARELRERASIRRLPAVMEQLKDLLARVQQLEATEHD